MVIAFLICDFTGRRGLGIVLNLIYAGFVYLLISGIVTSEQLQVLQLCNLPVVIVSRLIQVAFFFEALQLDFRDEIVCEVRTSCAFVDWFYEKLLMFRSFW